MTERIELNHDVSKDDNLIIVLSKLGVQIRVDLSEEEEENSKKPEDPFEGDSELRVELEKDKKDKKKEKGRKIKRKIRSKDRNY